MKQRAYINKAFNQFVDDECLRYRSVPMAVVDTILQVKRPNPQTYYAGVKRVFNNIPARPININAMATTIARMNGLPYSSVESISKSIGDEEVAAVKRFVKGNKDPFEVPEIASPKFDSQPSNLSTYSSLRQKNLRPTNLRPKVQQIGNEREVSLLLGDESQTYNTPGWSQQFSSSLQTSMRLHHFYKSPQFVFDAEDEQPQSSFLEEAAKKRAEAREIVNRALGTPDFVNLPSTNLERYLGIEPVPQVRHSNRAEAREIVNRALGTPDFVNISTNLDRYLGIEPVPQVRHSNRDTLFGERIEF